MSRYESGETIQLAEQERAVPAHVRAMRRWLILLVGVVSLSLAAGGYWYYRHEVDLIRAEKYHDLKAIADLKADQIVQWRHDRLEDARVHSTAPFFRNAVAQWVRASGDASLETGIRETLESICKSYDYEDVILAGTDGMALFSLKVRPAALEANEKQLVAQATSTGSVHFNDLYRCPACNRVHLDVAAPILDAEGRPAAVLLLRNDPEQYLYPLIQSWPTPSQTAETLLLRKDGEDVLFLNRLRHRPDPALTVRIPLSSADVPAVRAALGETDEFEGRDYRGVDVLADIRPVPGSPWFMVSKVDSGEILAEARYHGRIVLLFVVVSIVMTGGMGAFVFTHRQRGLYEDLYRAERRRREAVEETRTTLYSIGDAVIATDTAARVTRMNPVAEHLTGWREAEALGKPLEQVFRILNEETRAEADNPASRVVREGRVVGLANHTLLVARDGTERPIADSGSPIRNEDGQMTGVVLVFRDQTEQRRAERALRESRELFRATLYSIGDAVIATDTQGRVRQMNSVAEALTGWREAEASGEPLEQVFRILNEETRAEVENPVARVVREGRVVGLANHTLLVARDGTERPIADSGSPIRNEDGQMTGVVLVFRDQTEQRRAERALQEANWTLEQALARAEELAVRAEAANLAKSHFLANMSHEIRTPMTAILGFTELLRSPDLPHDERGEFLETIRRNGEALLGLINDILDLSRIEAERLTLERKDCPLRQVLEDVVSVVQLRAEQKGLSLAVDAGPGLPETIHTDPARLRQILVNLVSNAVKFTDRGGVRIAVRCPREAGADARIRFAVSDTGLGIPADKISELFQPFAQVHGPTSRVYGGTGLGLTISKRLAKSLGGDVEVSSELGKGSIFTLTIDAGLLGGLPVPEGVRGAAAGEEEPLPEPQDLALHGRVLLAEDVPDVQLVIAQMLRKANLRIDVAEDGRTACEMAEKSKAEGKPYDLILMDIRMPERNGYEATRWLRERGWEKPIVALTAYAMVGDREKCLDAGCDDYIAKPVTARGLQSFLARYLRRPDAPSGE